LQGTTGHGVPGGNAAAGGGTGLGAPWVFGQYVTWRNAAVLQISSLMMVIFSGLMVVAALVLIVGRRQGARPGVPRSRPVATVAALTSAMGLLLSSATIYLTYRPYWYIFERAIVNGDRSQARDLQEFLLAIRMLPFLQLGSNLALNLPMYCWTGVTILGILSLVIILLRHLRGHPSAAGLQNHPRVP
jgi:hypothetical protein